MNRNEVDYLPLISHKLRFLDIKPLNLFTENCNLCRAYNAAMSVKGIMTENIAASFKVSLYLTY